MLKNSAKVALEAGVGWGLLLGAVFAERRASLAPLRLSTLSAAPQLLSRYVAPEVP